MPVHKIQGGGYQYGQTGKKYYGKDAKEKAERQALAIRLSGYEEPSKKKKSLQHESDLAVSFMAAFKAIRNTTKSNTRFTVSVTSDAKALQCRKLFKAVIRHE